MGDLATVELTGDDRLEWLQGQATNDVRGLAPGGRVSFCLCEPTGQILAVIDAFAEADRLLMVTDRACVPAVLERVERMTILEDVAARALEDAIPYPDEAARIAAGVPRWGTDVGPRTLPPELGPAFEARHVGYTKGCYVGQEVLMRMHARGHTNRTWVGLVADAPMAAGVPVTFEGREVGRVSSAAPHPTLGFVAAATLRNEATADGTRVLAGDVEAEVRTMPILREG